MRVVVNEISPGVWGVFSRAESHVGTTLEKALAKAAPTAPAEKVLAAAEVLEGIMGSVGQSGQIHEGQVSA